MTAGPRAHSCRGPRTGTRESEQPIQRNLRARGGVATALDSVWSAASAGAARCTCCRGASALRRRRPAARGEPTRRHPLWRLLLNEALEEFGVGLQLRLGPAPASGFGGAGPARGGWQWPGVLAAARAAPARSAARAVVVPAAESHDDSERISIPSTEGRGLSEVGAVTGGCRAAPAAPVAVQQPTEAVIKHVAAVLLRGAAGAGPGALVLLPCAFGALHGRRRRR
jgi:hypothetical protein